MSPRKKTSNSAPVRVRQSVSKPATRSSRMLRAEDFYNTVPLRRRYIAALDGWVYVREASAIDLIRYQAAPKGDANIEATLQIIARCVVDEQGVPLFSEDQLDKLKGITMKAFRGLMDAVNSSIGDDDTDSEVEVTGAGTSPKGTQDPEIAPQSTV